MPVSYRKAVALSSPLERSSSGLSRKKSGLIDTRVKDIALS